MNKTPPLVAIVDDELSVRRALERLLRSAGVEVRTYASGAVFLDAIQTHPVDCVVLDLHMSEMNGFEVQAHLMRTGKWLPIIIMTGHDTPDSRARALAGGAVEYLLKPVDDQVLLDAIAKALANDKP